MTTLLNLANRLNQRVANIERRLNAVKIDCVLSMVRHLVFDTPVDTSQALSNWQVSVNVPIGLSIPPYVPGKRGNTQTQSAAITYARASSALAAPSNNATLYLSNLLVYVPILEATHARAGFVQRALSVGRNTVRQARIL